MKKLLMCLLLGSALIALPISAQAEMVPFNDNEMANVEGQLEIGVTVSNLDLNAHVEASGSLISSDMLAWPLVTFETIDLVADVSIADQIDVTIGICALLDPAIWIDVSMGGIEIAVSGGLTADLLTCVGVCMDTGNAHYGEYTPSYLTLVTADLTGTTVSIGSMDIGIDISLGSLFVPYCAP